MRTLRLAILVLIWCAWFTPLAVLASHPSPTRLTGPGDLPSQGTGIPIPIEGEFDWVVSDCDGESICLIALDSDSHHEFGFALRVRNLVGFSSPREMRNTLQRLRI